MAEIVLETNEQIKEYLEILQKAKYSFKFFVNNIFSKSFDHFVGGKYIDDTCDFLQNNKKTIRIAPKDHFKSTSFYAYFMWKLMFPKTHNLVAHYFSYEPNMAAYHTRNIKKLIELNPFFEGFEDLKPNADSILSYAVPTKNLYRRKTVSLYPQSLLAFKRGIHSPLIFVDDPLQDPENRLNPKNIEKINRIIKTQILDMPTKNGELHIVGTPQTPNDFFFDVDVTYRFKVKIMPAVVDEKRKIALWPEHMPFEELMIRKRERGERVFNQEYNCVPMTETDSWISRAEIQKVIDYSLPKNLRELKTENKVILGWDIGKKRHPSHIAIFEVMPDGTYVQRYSRFLDGWDYTRQVKLVNSLMDRFSVDSGYYDSTRGELEAIKENVGLHPRLRGVNFTQKKKFKMATKFEAKIYDNKIKLLDDFRQTDQICAVNSDLQAAETAAGHGESFWSISLCFADELIGTDFFILR